MSHPAANFTYELVTPANAAELGRPISLRRGDNPDRLIHPTLLRPFAVASEAGRLLLGVIGYVGEDPKLAFATTVDLASLAGIKTTTVPSAGLVIEFEYDKQAKGPEGKKRLFRPEAIYFGVHSGHRGIPAEGIAPEQPGYYFAGEQFDGAGLPEGARTFPFGRICGLMGRPDDQAFRQELGLY